MAQRKLAQQVAETGFAPPRRLTVALPGADTTAVASPAHELQRLVHKRVAANVSRDKYPIAIRLMLPIILSSLLWFGIISAIRAL